MKLLLGAVVLFAACEPVKDPNALPDAPHAGDDADIPEDSAIPVDAPPPRCDPNKPFGMPVRVDALSTNVAGAGTDDLHAVLSADELTVYFASNRAGGLGIYDIYTATRATTTDTWTNVALLGGAVNTTGEETHPSVSSDGLTLFASFRANPNSPYQVTRATRASTTAAFSALAPVTVINTVANNFDPYVLPDQSAIYWTSNRNANGDDDIYVATGTAGSFGTPAAAVGTSLNTTSGEANPVLTPDGLNIYFRSNRGSQYDIWVASRTSVANGFGAPVNVTSTNSNLPELPTWVSADNCILYFSRNVGTAASNYDIYSVTKPL